jgi:hypothetical protein
VPAQLRQRDVHADVDVADEADAGVVQRPVQGVADGAHLRVVGGDAVPDQAERGGQPVDQVDGDRDRRAADQRLGGVDAGRPGADHGHAQGGGRRPGSERRRPPRLASWPRRAVVRQVTTRPTHRPQQRGLLVSVVVVATISPKPEHADEVRQAVLETVPQVHEEPGCERYSLHQGRDGALVMVEKWRAPRRWPPTARPRR